MRRGYDYYESPCIGKIYMIVNEKGLEEIFLLESHFEIYHKQYPELQRDEEICKEVKRQLIEYFEGKRTEFELELDIQGTAFRKQVWEELMKIPYGQTISYKEVAERISNPKAVRAVGGAVGANLMPIVIPCHRVIGANGKMVGFMGPDHIDMKVRLLEHESQIIKETSQRG